MYRHLLLVIATLFGALGCVSTREIAVIPQVVRPLSLKTSETSKEETTFTTRFKELETFKTQDAGHDDVSASPAVRKMLATKLVQNVVNVVHDATVVKRVATAAEASKARPRLLSVSSDDIKAFKDALLMVDESLVDDAAAGKMSTAPNSFDRLLLEYLKAYASGEFVDYRGTEIAKPEFNGGVSNDAICGLTEVFWEALFDYSTGAPVLAAKDKKEKITTSYDPPPGYEGVVTPKYSRKMLLVPLTDGNREPTALASFPNRIVQVVSDPDAGINAKEAKAIRVVSNLAGKQAKSAAGSAFEFLSNFNVGFVVGGSFAVGDNRTLVELVKTSAEVISRRSVYAILYDRLKGATLTMDAESTSVVGSDSSLQNMVEEIGAR